MPEYNFGFNLHLGFEAIYVENIQDFCQILQIKFKDKQNPKLQYPSYFIVYTYSTTPWC